MLSRSRTRIDLLFTMSEITHATSSRSDACETVFSFADGLAWPSSARLRSSSFAAAAFAPIGLAEPKLAKQAKAGGARRDRTDDLLLAKQALSQLSYGPPKALVDVPASPIRGMPSRSSQSERRLVGLGR